MIHVFIGNLGSGKTLSMVYHGYKEFLKGRKIYSNFNLDFEHEKLTFKMIKDYVKTSNQLKNCVLLLDELHILIDSRSSFKNKLLTYFILQTRKRGVDLYGTTQFFGQVDVRLRNACNKISTSDFYLLYNNQLQPYIFDVMKGFDMELINNIFCMNRTTEKLNKGFETDYIETQTFFNVKEIMNKYDTDELIGFSDE